MRDPILDEQIAYYRARAQEYDQSVSGISQPNAENSEPPAGLAEAHALLRGMGPFEQVLELACGTGIWTQTLRQIGREITAVDAAPEMLEITRQKLGDSHIHYQQANLFEWTPAATYDLIFFAFWLSHVPPEALDAFLNNVQRAVRPGGQLVIIDQFAPTDEDRSVAKDTIHATRPLLDGRTFTIVKVFYELPFLADKLTRLGFDATVRQLNDTFFFLSASL